MKQASCNSGPHKFDQWGAFDESSAAPLADSVDQADTSICSC
jgi:hypothetical protein